MPKKYSTLSEVLRRLLFERNMKAVDLAREVNIPQPTIHRLITGKSTRPYASSLQPIADYFSITVEQLLGDAPLFDIAEKDKAPTKNQIKKIPIISWQTITQLEEAKQASTHSVSVTQDISSASFALIMPDSSMEPLFPRGTILIFNPELNPKDRCYALVKLHDKDIPIFRQLLIDMDHTYLKPLNPDLSSFQLRALSQEDVILACLHESRINHHMQDGNNPLEELPYDK